MGFESVSERAGAAADLKRKRRNKASSNGTLDRLPPHSTEAEQGVLGCALLSPNEHLPGLVFKLPPDSFYDLRHRTIFNTLVAMQQDGAGVDIITLQQRLKDAGLLEQIGGIAYLAQLQDSVPSAANLSYYLDIVREKYLLRRMIATCTDVVGRVYDHTGSISDLKTSVQSGLAEVFGDNSGGAEAKPIGALVLPTPENDDSVYRERYVTCGDICLLVGRTGDGKGSLALQIALTSALGKPCAGLRPKRPLISLVIGAEDNEGDVAERREGIANGLGFTQEERRESFSRVFYHFCDSKSGTNFLHGVVRPLLARYRPDVLWLDPALAYVGGDQNDQEIVGNFLRLGLNPLLHEFKCACFLIHHTVKRKADGPQTTSDFLYSGSGSAEWSNVARAVLSLETVGQGVFKLHAPKRGARLQWADADGNTTYDRFIRHSRKAGEICWFPADAEDATSAVVSGKTGNDLLALVPRDQEVGKNMLIVKAQGSGIGAIKARALLDDLIESGKLFEWRVRRRGTNPKKYIARYPQPEGANDQ